MKYFQTFFLSNEISKCPLISNAIEICKELCGKNILKNHGNGLSIRYGNRIVITGEDANLCDLSVKDFIEVVDFDPFKKTALVIGLKEVDSYVQTHWLIYRARNDVNVVFHLKNFDENIDRDLPEFKGNGSLEFSLNILKALKNNKYVLTRDGTLFIVGRSLQEIKKTIVEMKERKKL